MVDILTHNRSPKRFPIITLGKGTREDAWPRFLKDEHGSRCRAGEKRFHRVTNRDRRPYFACTRGDVVYIPPQSKITFLQLCFWEEPAIMDLVHRKPQHADTRTGRDCGFCHRLDPEFSKRKPMDRWVVRELDDTASVACMTFVCKRNTRSVPALKSLFASRTRRVISQAQFQRVRRRRPSR